MKNEQITSVDSVDLTSDEKAEACLAIIDSEAIIVLAIINGKDGEKNLHSTIAGQKGILSAMIKQGIFDDKSLSVVVSHAMSMSIEEKISAFEEKQNKCD